MKKTFAILSLVALLCMTVLAGCGGKNKDEDTGASGEKKEKVKLVMATSADYPPYEDIDTTDGETIVGFDVDIANYIAKKLDFEFEIKNMDFNGLIGALQSGRADFVMAGMTPDPDRKKNADFTDIYFEATNTIVAKKGSNLTTLEQLAGKKVGVQLGSTQEEAAGKIKGAKLKSLNKIPEIIQELKTGRIDAAIIEDTVAKGYTKSNDDLEFNAVPNEGLAGSAIAFPKGSKYVEQFNQVLKEMKENGELDKLVKKWFE